VILSVALAAVFGDMVFRLLVSRSLLIGMRARAER
jgi:hypothetical protein